MSLKDIQFAESSTEQRQKRGSSGGLTRGGTWAIRRAPSWRRSGPKAIVAKTARNVAFDVLAVVAGLVIGLAVVGILSLF